MNSTTSHRFHWAWVILGICFLDLFVNYSIRLGYGVVMPEMIQDLGFTRMAGGTIYNAYLFAYILLTPFAGYCTDRFGGRRVITICSLILGLGVFGMGTAKTLTMACIFYALAGIGATGMWTPVITVVQRWFAPHRRGLALGILGTGYGFGLAAIGLAFPLIVHAYSWRYAWYILGISALLLSVGNGSLLRSDPKTHGYKPWGEKTEPLDPAQSPALSGQPLPRSWSNFIKNSNFWLIGFSYFAVSYCLYGITTFMVDYARNQIGMPLEKASLLATIHGLGQVVGVLTILPLSDYFTRKRTLLVSNALIALVVIGIFLFGKSWLSLAILIGIMALFYGATFPLYGACGGDYFPKQVMGTVIGLWTFLYGSGAMLANWISGLIRDHSGSYHQAFLIDAVMAGIGLLLMCFVKKTLRSGRA